MLGTPPSVAVIEMRLSRISPRRVAGVLVAALLAALAFPASAAPPRARPDVVKEPASLVRPLSGTAGVGFPFVGAARPFGMIQAGPDTAVPGHSDQINYTGYAYQDPMIRGFSLTHFSGAGAHLAGDVSFLPTTGPITSTDPNSYASTFTHAKESASPGFYGVDLQTYQTSVELTATERAAYFRFRYPAGAAAHVLIDVGHNIAGEQTGGVRLVGRRTVQGWLKTTANPGSYTVYFTAQFDRDFSTFGTWTPAGQAPGAREAHGNAGAYVDFDTSRAAEVGMRVAISYVDIAGSAANLAAELPAGSSFDRIRDDAARAWNAALSHVQIGGGSAEQQQTFYTCLYRAMLMPSIFDDVTGRYRGLDRKVHTVQRGHHHYTNLSLWDTYRTQTTLLSLISPDVMRDVFTTILDDADHNRGVLPRWVIATVDTGVMSGYPAVVVLSQVITSGLVTPAEARRAYRVMKRQAGQMTKTFPYRELPDYVRLGYVGFDHSTYAGSDTLEYALADAALLRVARRHGTRSEIATFTRRAANWKRLLDPSTHFLRPRNSDGSWANPSGVGPAAFFDPTQQDGFQEGTAWQYLWSVPQDIPGLVKAVGGVDVARARLDQFFSEALNEPAVPVVSAAQQHRSLFGIYYVGDQYTPGNEPDLWAPWFYNWVGQPSKAQKVVQAALTNFSTRPDGLPGNDDAGELSSWYVMASLGLYKVGPASGTFAMSTPSFPIAVVHLPGHRDLTVTTSGDATTTRYIESAAIHGARLPNPFVTELQLRRGGTLAITISSTPSPSWGSATSLSPAQEGSP